MNAKDNNAMTAVRLNLRSRLSSAELSRTPGGVQPSGVYWNGFCVGLAVALEVIGREFGEEGDK